MEEELWQSVSMAVNNIPEDYNTLAASQKESLVLQLIELRQLLLLQSALIQEQGQEIQSQQARVSAAQKEIEKRDQKIARLERHSLLKEKNDRRNTPALPIKSIKTQRLVDRATKSSSDERQFSPQPSLAHSSVSQVLPKYQETNRVYGFTSIPQREKEEVLAIYGDGYAYDDYDEMHTDVPAWREPNLSRNGRLSLGNSTITTETAEDYSDEAYERRHRKYEQMEKRRKRADREQALIALQQQESAGYFGSAPPTTAPSIRPFSFSPDPLVHLQVIELTDRLPLVAWGQPVPKMRAEPFSLPRLGEYSFDNEIEFVTYRRASTDQSHLQQRTTPQSSMRPRQRSLRHSETPPSTTTTTATSSPTTSNVSLRPR